MKLVRITTDDQLAVFETKFNEDIVLEPNSQMALSNASFDTVFKNLEIDANNDTIKYKIRVADEKTIQLNHGTYTSSETDTNDMMAQLENKFNEGLTFAGGEIGASFRVNNTDVNHPTQGKVSFFCRRANYATITSDFEFTNGAAINKDNGVTKRALFQQSGADRANDQCKVLGIELFAQGCAIVRTKIRSLVDNGSVDNGFRMWLTDNTVDTISGNDDVKTENTKLYLQVAPKAGDTDTFKYSHSVNGAVLVDSAKDVLSHAIAGGGDPSNDGAGDVANSNNDIIEFRQQSGNLSIFLYRNGQAASEEIAVIAYDYTTAGNNRLYFGMSFQGQKANTSVEALKVSFDPFAPPVSRTYEATVLDDLEVSAGLPPPTPNQRIAPATFEVTIDSVELRDYLGFENQVNTSALLYQSQILGDYLFTANLMNDSFVFELLNIDIESYDSFSGGQRNILKVIPAAGSDADTTIDYEASNLVFVDLRNKYPITLRNIKARILRNDLEPIVVRGMSVCTLLIREKGENM